MKGSIGFDQYVQGFAYGVLIAFFAYPFLSFILRKYVSGKWKIRLLFLFFIMMGMNFFYPVFSDFLTFLLFVCSGISYCLYYVAADYFSKIKKLGRLFLEGIWTFILLLFPLIILALAGNFRMSATILERFPDGSYTFFPGYWDTLVQTAFLLTIVLIPSKYIYEYGVEKQEKIKQRKIRASTLEKELIEAQLDALHAQINPHFLYNSLNAIAGLAMVDGEKTRQMALALSRFFRYSVSKKNSRLVSLEEEIEMVKVYLEIEKIRFGDRLDYRIELSATCQNRKVPRLFLQPLVENCIRHGWKGNIELFRIRISICLRDMELQIAVEDNGIPFPDDLVPGYGLKNVSDKLQLQFSGEARLELINTPVKKVLITLPVD